LPLIVEALALAPRSQIIDGEAVACDDEDGIARFERIVSKGRNSAYRSGRSPDWIKRSTRSS
jgi:ATP-dependent DNA ligase